MGGTSAALLAAGPHGAVALIGGGMALAGLAAVALGLLLVLPAGLRRRHVMRAEGRIVGHDVRPSRGFDASGPYYFPVVEFTTGNGEVVRGAARTGMNVPAGKPGTVATVWYDPADPRRISVETGRTNAMRGCGGAVAIALGAVFTFFGILVFSIGRH